MRKRPRRRACRSFVPYSSWIQRRRQRGPTGGLIFTDAIYWSRLSGRRANALRKFIYPGVRVGVTRGRTRLIAADERLLLHPNRTSYHCSSALDRRWMLVI